MDEYPTEHLAFEVETSIGARRVIAALGRVFAEQGPAGRLRSGSVPELMPGC